MKMAKAFIGTAMLALSVACSGGGIVDDVEKLSGEMCACKDKACTVAVGKKFDALKEKYKKPSDDTIKKLGPIMEKTQACQEKFAEK